MRDTITLSVSTADALSRVGLGDFHTVEQPERMAAVVLVLRLLDDDDDRYPRGKWATIQAIEAQLDEWARETADALRSGGGT